MTQPFDLEKYKAEQDRARELGFDYAVIRNIILHANSDFEDGISMGKAIELIREIGLQAVDKAVTEDRAAMVAWLRKEAVSHRRDGFPIASYTMEERADAIERGEHRSEENQTLKETLTKPRQDGIIDQMGRKLPLPDHHKDCPHGQNGWAMCTCEELKSRDIRNAKALDGVFDDLMDDDEGPKKCLHGNLECKRCNPTRAIKTPEGNPFLPAADFSRIRIEDNKECGHSECNYQRRTGRTTAMVIKALEFVIVDHDSRVIIEAHNNRMKKVIREWLKHYADELGVSHGDLGRIIVREPGEYSPGGALTLRDNALDDAKSFKDLVDEGQELRKKFDKDTAGMRGAPNCPKCGDTGLISYGPGTRGMKRCDCQTRRLVEEDEFTRVMNETYEHLPPRPRDPRQDLKPGDHVRFEIEGIIKERQSAGIFQDEDGDFEPIQYAIKDSINGKTYYVGYHQITKKIGSVE